MAGLVRKAELWALRLIAASIVGVPLVLFVVAHLLARQMPTLHVITDRPAIAAYIPPTGAQPVIPYGSSTATFPVGVQNTPGVVVQNTLGVNVQNTIGVVIGGATVNVSGTVGISPIPLPVVPTGTFSVSVQNTVGVAVQNTIGVVQQATVPISAPTIGVAVQNTVGVIAQATVPISAGTLGVSVQNTPAVQGSVSLNNTPGVLVQGTIGVAVQNTPAIQGSVSINNTPAIQGSVSLNNTPGVLPFDQIAGPTSLATTSAPNSNLDIVTQGQSSIEIEIQGTFTGTITFKGHSPTNLTLISAYPLTNNEPSGAGQTTFACAGTCDQKFFIPCNGIDLIRLQMTSFTSGSASVGAIAGPGSQYPWILNTPAIQGSVSLNNTPGVLVQNTVLVTQPTADPCQNPALIHSFTNISFATATTGGENTQRLVAGNGSKQVYVCDCAFDIQATAGTPTYAIKFIQATPTATTGGIQCTATATVALSGDYMSGAHTIGGGSSTVMNVGAGNSLCVRSLGIANIQGRCSYVQQ